MSGCQTECDGLPLKDTSDFLLTNQPYTLLYYLHPALCALEGLTMLGIFMAKRNGDIPKLNLMRQQILTLDSPCYCTYQY